MRWAGPERAGKIKVAGKRENKSVSVLAGFVCFLKTNTKIHSD